MEELTAVLLCGGKGERLKPFTDSLPKPLVPLAGRPLLDHLLSYLKGAGVRRFVVCTGYKPEAIEEHVAAYTRRGWAIECVDSGNASMTDRLISVRSRLAGPALVCYGDTLANVDIQALSACHRSSGLEATLTVYPLRSPFGIVEFTDDKRVTQFREKPLLPHWINIGFLLLGQQALERLEPKSDMVQFLDRLAERRQLGVYQHSGRHLTVNTEKERAEAENQIEFFTLPGGSLDEG